MYSRLALERGTAQTALKFAKQSMRLLRRAWANTEEQSRRRNSVRDSPTKETIETTDDVSHLSTTAISLPPNGRDTSFGKSFWPLITPLFRGLRYLSALYAHHGLFQETLYYAQEAHKLVSETDSKIYIAVSSALLGRIYLKSGSLDKGSEFLQIAQQVSIPSADSWEKAALLYYTGQMQGLLGEREAEVNSYDEADRILGGLTEASYIDTVDKIVLGPATLEESFEQLSISKRKVTIARKTARSRPKAVTKSKASNKPKTPVETTQPVGEACMQLLAFRNTIIRQKARAFMSIKKISEAIDLLRCISTQGIVHIEIIDHGLVMAKQLLLQSMSEMAADPVYSVLQDSTISFPSVVGFNKSEKVGDRLSANRVSPVRKGAKNQDLARSKSPSPDTFFDKLQQAQEYLTEVYSLSIALAPLAVVHEISTLLNSVAILFSALGHHSKGRTIANPGFASCSIGISSCVGTWHFN